MAFSSAQYDRIYDSFLVKLGKDVTLRYNNGTGYSNFTARAYVTRYREDDIVPGGSIEIGDLRLIIPESELPGQRNMERKDRIDIDGRNYSVIHYDTETRAMGADVVAVEITVRG